MIVRGTQSELKAEVYLQGVGLSDTTISHIRQYSNVTDDLISLELVAAIIQVESGGRRYAIRYEKNYRWLFRPDFYRSELCSTDTERELQKFSYGYMQVMGSVFRETLPNIGRVLPDVAFHEFYNVLAGVEHLDNLRQRWEIKDQDALISAYNQGSPRRSLLTGKFKNQKYVDKVLKEMRKFTEWTS